MSVAVLPLLTCFCMSTPGAAMLSRPGGWALAPSLCGQLWRPLAAGHHPSHQACVHTNTAFNSWGGKPLGQFVDHVWCRRLAASCEEIWGQMQPAARRLLRCRTAADRCMMRLAVVLHRSSPLQLLRPELPVSSCRPACHSQLAPKTEYSMLQQYFIHFPAGRDLRPLPAAGLLATIWAVRLACCLAWCS